MCHEVIIKTLKELIKTVIKIDNKLYERAIKKRYNNLYNRTDIYIRIHISYHQDEIRFFKRKNNFYTETVSIKLNFTQ